MMDIKNSKEIEQLGQQTSIDEVAQVIQRSLSEDQQSSSPGAPSEVQPRAADQD
jgi:hypothetical protein